MLLSKITINNFRLIVNAELDVHRNITLIVGRNNTAKTSCMSILEKVVKNKVLSYNDYPLQRRKYAFILLAQFMRKKITYEQLCKRLPLTSIEFLIDYSLDDAEDNLGALSPFIIDVDVDTTTALVKAEYSLKMDEESLRNYFHTCFYKDGAFALDPQETKEVCSTNFSKIFELVIYAINPKNKADVQIKTQKELADLFPFYPIPAERVLGEATEQNYNSLGTLISSYFSVDIKNLDPKIAADVLKLRETVEEANKSIQRESSNLLSSIVGKAIGFGYPNGEELQLGVNTKLQIDNQIKDQTELTYTAPLAGEALPSSHNGLGYKNLIPSTIHSFAWNAIKQYQSTLIKIISEDESLWSTEGDFFAIRKVEYTLGHRYNENGIMYLYHDDVIRLFAALLDNAKFRRVFSDKYPLILIDEYQDSLKPIIDRFLEYFISLNSGPQFGFFGDSWQTIYQSNKACGLIQHENIVEIKKGANFRSAPKIVDLLNFIRPELPQRSAIDNFAGEVTVITCDDYIGERRTDRNFKGDLPSPELKERLNGLMKHIKHSCIPASENVKTLMITHRVLAAQQGYNKLLDILKDGLRDKEDPFLLFFMEQLEPIYQALETNDMQLLFDTLKLKRYPITKKAEKVKWKNLQEALKIARQKNSVDVLQTVFEAKLIPIPAKIDGYYDLYLNAPETMYSGADVTIKDFLDIEYEQFLAAINYFHPEADFSTEHGVKGEEYDNVIFVISKGWNQYQFETYTPMIKNGYPQDKEAAYIRNRNLFYVCCSRPKKRLYFFVSVPVDRVFRKFLAEMVGEDNILTYSEFLNSQNHSKTE